MNKREEKMTMKPKSVHMQKLSKNVLVSLLALIPAIVSASTTKYNFAAPVVTSSTEAPGTWYPDRYAPCGFVSPETAPDQTKHTLEETICASDYQGTDSFYNTQGRKYDLPAKRYSLTISLYVPSNWGTTNGRMAGFWATALDSTGAIEAYPIIEFQGPITSDAGGPSYHPNGGVAGFYGWDTTNGVFVYIGLPKGFNYNTWVQLTMPPAGGKRLHIHCYQSFDPQGCVQHDLRFVWRIAYERNPARLQL